MAVLELGLNGNQQSIHIPWAPHWAPIYIMDFLPSPSLGDGSSTGPMALWIDNSEKTAVAEVVPIYTRADLEGTPNTNTKGKKEGKETLWKRFHNKQNNLRYV